ncbi:MAG: terminase small subunit [Sphingopyxis sp.]|nr:terminase small subunit [Sphingopyxis sp.]
MPRNTRTTSVAESVRIAQAASKPLDPPANVPLTTADESFWNSIIAEKARSEWTGHDLEIAALLARSMRCMVVEESKMEDEGAVLTTVGGNRCQNPRARIIADLNARIMKYRQSLGIHSRGKQGEPRDVKRRRDHAKSLEADLDTTDLLFAKPH